MAYLDIPQPPARVTTLTTRLLDLAGQVDGYWARNELSIAYRDAWPYLPASEREAFVLIEKGLFRLFPFEPELDLPEKTTPRHAI